MPKAAAATFDDDFGMGEPRRRAAAPRGPRAAPGKGRGGRKRGRFAIDMVKVARVAAVGMGATLAGGILVNALVMQKSRHPAPLFTRTLAMPAAQPAAAPPKPGPAAVSAAVLAPPAVPQAPQPSVSAPAPAAGAKPHHAATGAAPDRAAGDDAIARLLAGAGDKSTGKATLPKAGATANGKAVMAVQRALAKLGFAVKASGTFGPQTRTAIAAFEKDRHFAVTGEMSPRLVKVLSAESGINVE